MPEKVIKKFYKNILPEWKVCFGSAILVGLIAHLYKITNWLPNWDSLVFRYDSQNMVAMGRWFLPVACSFSSFYDLPFLNGLLAIVFHALSAVCICRILNVKKKITALLVGAVIVSFPTVTSLMMYNYAADGYSVAFFFAVLAAYYMTREKPRYIWAVVLIALSAGIYQAYITVTIVLLLLKLIDEMLYQKQTIQVFFKKMAFMLLTGVLGVVLYGIVMKLALNVWNVELLDYQGMNTTASLANMNILASLYVVKEIFRKSLFDLSNGINVYVVLNVAVMIFTLVYYVKYIVREKFHKKPLTLLLIILLVILLVFGASALAFVNAKVDYHNLMRMGYVAFYLLFLLLYERKTEQNENKEFFKCWAVLGLATILISNQVVIANVSYHKAQMAYEKSYGALVRIADRIEQVEGVEMCDELLVIGSLENSDSYSVNLTPDITGITDGYIIRKDDEIVGQSVLCSALNDYCEKNYTFVSGAKKQELMQREDVMAMKVWPDAECISILEDVIIIKLSAED